MTGSTQTTAHLDRAGAWVRDPYSGELHASDSDAARALFEPRSAATVPAVAVPADGTPPTTAKADSSPTPKRTRKRHPKGNS